MPNIKPRREISLANLLINSKISPFLVPPLLWIGAWEFQLDLNPFVKMPSGHTAVMLTTGVRVFAGLVFGIKGLLGLTAGSILWMYAFPDKQYNQEFEQLATLSVIFAIIVYFSIEIVRRFRKLDDIFNNVKIVDVFCMLAFTSFLCSLAKFILIPRPNTVSEFELFTLGVFSRFVGGSLSFFLLMLFFELLSRVKIHK